MSVLRNPVLLLTWGLPLTAVVASFLTLGIVLMHPDGELPEQYHWEGFQLDRDFSRGERATQLGVRANLTGFDKTGKCNLELIMSHATPEVLTLSLVHATQPALDQRVILRRVQADGEVGAPAFYAGECRAVSDGHWRLELSDAINGWAVRESVRGAPYAVTLDARSAQDD